MAKLGPSKNTRCEIKVREALDRLRVRYLLHFAGLPGRPDIFIPHYNIVVYVDGRFWHDPRGKTKSMGKFWRDKIKRNYDRDNSNRRKLTRMGLTRIRIWDDMLDDGIKRLTALIESRPEPFRIFARGLRSRPEPSSAAARSSRRRTSHQGYRSRSRQGTTEASQPLRMKGT